MPIKIAIIHPKIGRGGSEATALWMIDALKDDYRISLITGGSVDLPELNNFYGTNLKEDFSVINVPMPFGLATKDKFAAIRGRFIQRYCKKIAKNFDLMINAYNPCDFGVPGIQFATDIALLPTILPLKGFKKIFYGKTFLRKAYLKICDLISSENPKNWSKNLTLANSFWTAKLMNQLYSIDSQVLYPPVNDILKNEDQKEMGFVCIGRIVPEKRFEEIVAMLEEVRLMGNNIHLHIIGKFVQNKYANSLKEKCAARKDWIFLEENLDKGQKNNLISKHLFGISARKNEPFGIAVAEMAKAGCIVFVPNGGGQTEIVENKNLIYENHADAVSKINKLLQNEFLQKEALGQLQNKLKNYSVENFQKQIKNIVAGWLL